MQINYPKILKKNLINVFKDVILEVEKNGLKEGNHLYITFKTNYVDVKIPSWLKKKFPGVMTIVIQYEYWNLKVLENKFEILLSFNGSKTNLTIPYKSIISFADPYANFGLKLNDNKSNTVEKNINKKIKTNEIIEKDNIINFSKFKNSI